MANKYWDRTSKVLICLIDALLNLWFLHIVRHRLVRYHGLVKYTSLVRFNSYLIAISISMDVRTRFTPHLDFANPSGLTFFQTVGSNNRPHVSQKPAGLRAIPPSGVHDQTQHRAIHGSFDHEIGPKPC